MATGSPRHKPDFRRMNVIVIIGMISNLVRCRRTQDAMSLHGIMLESVEDPVPPLEHTPSVAVKSVVADTDVLPPF